MKFTTLVNKLFLVLILLACSTGIYAQCANVSSPEDDAVWSKLNDNDEYQSWFRDEFCSTLVLNEGDWNGGWGWDHLEDHTRAFSKMYTAARILYSGLSQMPTNWMSRKVIFNLSYFPSIPSKPVLSFDNEGQAHVFVRDGKGHLIHVIYEPLKADPASTIIQEDITQSTSLETFKGDVAVVRGPNSGGMRILGFSDDLPGNVILFEQQTDALTGGWKMTMLNPSEITPPYSYGPMLMGNPIVLQEPNGVLHVYGVSEEQCVIEYAWNPTEGIYIRQALDGVPPKWKISRSKGSIAGIYVQDTGIHVFAINEPTGDLLHISYNMGQWKLENLTNIVGSEYSLDPKSTLAVQSPGSGHITVFGRKQEGDLLRYSFKKIDLLNGNQIWQWQAKNITQTGTNMVEPQGYLVEKVRIEPGFTILNNDRVFGFDWRNDFAYFKNNGGQWTQIRHLLFEGLSNYLPNWDKSDRLVAWPVAVEDDGSIQEVYGVNTKHHLVRYQNLPPSMSWTIDRIPIPSGEYENSFLMKDLMVDAKIHPNGELHIVGIKDYGGLVHFIRTTSHGWHSTADYIHWASGNSQGADFYYTPYNTGAGGTTAAWSYCGWFRDDRVEMWCPSFEADFGPAKRAGFFLHEATHIKFGDWTDVWNGDHDPKDEWFYHGLDAIPWGTLDPGTDGHKHSMYQIQVEFLSDIAEFPAYWVPLSIIQSAKSAANSYIDGFFSNTPNWHVGEPRPF